MSLLPTGFTPHSTRARAVQSFFSSLVKPKLMREVPLTTSVSFCVLITRTSRYPPTSRVFLSSLYNSTAETAGANTILALISVANFLLILCVALCKFLVFLRR